MNEGQRPDEESVCSAAMILVRFEWRRRAASDVDWRLRPTRGVH